MATPTHHNLLLVEDNSGDARLIEELLNDAGLPLDVHWVKTLQAGVEYLAASPVDLVLLDLELPDSQGSETLNRILPASADVPVIVLTGLSDERMGLEMIQRGAQDYLVKGQVDAALLQRSVRYAMERKRADAQKQDLEERLRQSQKMEAIGKLAGGIAHNFNNLLGAVAGYADMIRVAAAPESKTARYATMILSASERGEGLTRKLLAFARKAYLSMTPVNCNDLIAQTAAILRDTLDPGIDVVTDLSSTSSMVLGDDSELTNVLLNLGINARDAMPTGGRIRFESSMIPPPHSADSGLPENFRGVACVRICVSDNGTGMGEATKRRVFEPFFTTKEKGKGTGLGLASAYGAVKQHNGAISLVSELGRGTCFTILLPAIAGTGAQGSAETAREPVRGAGRILVVDDEEVVLSLAGEMLTEFGYEVATCSDGESAVRYFEVHHTELAAVVLDVMMPVMDGRQCLVKMLQIDPVAKIIASSGCGDKEKEDSMLRHGAIRFLKKPYRMEELSRMVADVLRAP